MLPIVLGLSDGILTVLTFAANRLTKSTNPVTLDLTLRFSIAALVSGALVYFLSQYAELRNQLVHSEKVLNLTSHGKLATTRLGQEVIFDAVKATIIASTSAFIGAFVPLIIAYLIPQYPFTPILSALAALAFLGIGLARVVYGNALRWSILLIISGVLLWYIGSKIQII